ncbi:methyltransferase, TIGR04325 family [Reyranella sp.]|uniref:methyltransferase, TIGR04325 family n=1 Tax=Reyranella sp. TaxID=1929291 RepID=UPI003BAA1560
MSEEIVAAGLTFALRRRLAHIARIGIGRYRALRPDRHRFLGAYRSHEEALQHVRSGRGKGYDNDGVSEVSKALMQEVPLWDYPVLFWLQRLSPEIHRIVDAGGHIGVKYRAFSRYLDLDRIDWVVYDVPAQVRAGRAAVRPQDRTLSFADRLEDVPPADLLLGSGLLPYLDQPLTELVGRLRQRPRHILLNKVATRDGPTVVTLENFRLAEVPYHIRNVREVPDALDALGYDIVDSWIIDPLGHRIDTHPQLGRVVSRGYAARSRDTMASSASR